MSQYGHHSHYQSPVGSSDKPWDLVAAAAAAAAANVNIKSPVSGAFSFPNGFQTINGGGNNGSNGSGVYLNNGSSSSHQNLHVPQSPPTWQQETSRLYGNNHQNSAWIDQQQRQTQQQAHILSGNASSYFAGHHLTSPISPLNSRATGWSKLPQALITGVADDSSLKYETHSQQSPTYLSSRYGVNCSSSLTTSSVASDSNASFNGLLAATGSAVSSAVTAAALSKLPHYQSTNLTYQQQINDSNVVGCQSGPLYHSSLELEMLRSLANSAAISSASDVFSTKMSPNFSPPMQNYASSALNDVGMRGISSAALSAYFASNVSNASRSGVKREPSISPHMDSTDLEAAKTMLSIQTNMAKDNSSLNCEYQQISPATSDASTKTHSPLTSGNQNDASFINKGHSSDSYITKTDTTISSNRNLQISRDDLRAQKTIDVPTVNNIERSSIPTSAKNAQETSDKRSILDTGYSKDHIKYSEINASPMQNRSNEENLSEHSPRGKFSSGLSVVSMKSSAQGMSPCKSGGSEISSSPRDKTVAEIALNGSSTVSNRTVRPVAILSPPSSNSPSRSGSISSNTPVSGYGLQPRSATNQGTIYNCHICKFSSTSKFHFNSHMNTHADHKCTYCDYTSRTEGRLKRHMKDFHTHPNTEDLLMESEDFDGRCSPPSPDENSALIEQELLAVVSSVAHQSSEYGSSNSSTKDKPTTSGKPKTYRCKQCTFLATSKTEFWLHQKSAHIKGDRVLSCPKCLFVTEYKHHLEYHLRNHFGSKPFKCAKCNYSCVNKSMLNSHMKSHSNFYQYRCDDCTYATKYCHSLKMHLRKYGHRPASVINMDGSSTEPTVIDVYGNRRGPRSKKNNGHLSNSVQNISALLPTNTAPSGLHGNNLGSNTPSLAPLMEALQNSYLKQQQDLATAMVTSIATLGAQLPTVPSFRSDSSLMDDNNLQNQSSSQQFLKCSLCDFETEDGKDVLTVHVMTHIMKNKDLCNLYGLGETSTSSTNSSSSTPNDNFNGSAGHDVSTRLSSTPKDDHQRSRSSSFVTRFADTTSPVRASPMQELSQDSNSPASASCDKNSGDESVGGVEMTQHKSRRRKGKAYKLDKIALRLQGRTSPSASSLKDVDPEMMDSPEAVGTSVSLSAATSALYPNLCANPISEAAEDDDQGTPISKRSFSPSVTSRSSLVESQQSFSGIVQSTSAANTPVAEETDAELSQKLCHSVQPMDIDWSNAYVCNYCEIAFKDCIMYTIHMGYHGFRNPYKCNTCGHVSDGRLSMFLHIARAPHP